MTTRTFDLSTIGEGQIRLTAGRGERLVTAQSLRMNAACSEANVAGLLAQLGRRARWTTSMPSGCLAERVLGEFRSVGVDMAAVVRRDSGRVALYFMEPGESPMPGNVLYDREHTPFRSTDVADYDWDLILDADMVFLTGITAALTETTARVVRYAADAARERGIDVALDVNYRSKLWDGEDAAAVLEPIAAEASVLFCSRRDAETVFGVKAQGAEAAAALRERFGNPYVVSTDQCAGVYLADASGTEVFPVERVPVLDRPGAGDAFVAGALHGCMAGDVRAGIGYGRRVARYALTHYGDLTRIRPGELDIPTSTDIIR
jgi:2-dehydro-3-deoxygluconokinase